MRLRVRLLPLLLVCVVAFVSAGCVNVAGGGIALSLVTFLVLALGLGAVACSDDTPQSNNPTNGWDVGEDIRSGDAVDSDDVQEVPDGDPLDADADDDAGVWEACCNNGVVDSCFCPANMICNYGMYQDCGAGVCVLGGTVEHCPDTDAGGSDVLDDIDEDIDEDTVESDVEDGDAGTWQSCCKNGVVDSCFCPANMACNYGMYQDCGDGVCVFGGQTCPADGEGL